MTPVFMTIQNRRKMPDLTVVKCPFSSSAKKKVCMKVKERKVAEKFGVIWK